MKNVLKHAKANVSIRDKETGELLFNKSNLFVDAGRALIAGLFLGTIGIDKTKYACDFGDDATTPAVNDVDLVNYIDVSVGINEPSYPMALSGEGTGVHFQFEYSAAGDTTIRELGLFHRPTSASFPAAVRGVDDVGDMLARLVTTYGSIFVGTGRTITIDWKIIF